MTPSEEKPEVQIHFISPSLNKEAATLWEGMISYVLAGLEAERQLGLTEQEQSNDTE